MTTSTFYHSPPPSTLRHVKHEQQQDEYKKRPSCMINQDEVEAGSILVALANSNKTNSKSMSIHNLLESDNIRKEQQQPYNNHHHRSSHDHQQLRYIGESSLADSVPSTPPSHPNDIITYNKQRHPSDIDGRMQVMSGETYFGHQQLQQQQQQQQQHASTTRSEYQYHHQHHQIPRQPQQPRSTFHKSDHLQQQQQQQNNEFSKQYINMKRNPKIRRNALQAYISYMTYTDIARKRIMKQQQQQQQPPTLETKQHVVAVHKHQPYQHHHQHRRSNSLYNRVERGKVAPHQRSNSISSNTTTTRRQQQQQQVMSPPTPTTTVRTSLPPLNNKVIVDQPLTAFLHRPAQEVVVQIHRYPPNQYQNSPLPPPPPSSKR